MCDLDDDKKLNLNSSAIFFGNDTQKAIILFSMLFLGVIIILAVKNYSLILGVGVIFLFYQIYLQNELSKANKNLDAFKANSHIGLVIAILLFIENQNELFS